nr:hypothetical protein [uncultured Mogibacterium sp.]
MKKNYPMINCKKGYDTLMFFVNCGGEEYYLFSQKYRMSVYRYFKDGVSYRQAQKYDQAVPVQKTMSRIPMAIREVEQIYNLEILDRTKKKNNRRREYAKYPVAV